MGDEELRALERRWRETGEVEDEARWHLARVRAGALAAERLELAAHVGEPSALLALGRPASLPTTSRQARWWFAELDHHGHDARRRAALAESAHHLGEAAQVVRRARETSSPADIDGERAIVRGLRALWEALARFTLSPEDEAVRSRLRAVGEGLPRLLQSVSDGPAQRALRPLQGVRPDLVNEVGPRLWLPSSSLYHRSDEELRACLRAVPAAIGPWALALRDPLVVTTPA